MIYYIITGIYLLLVGIIGIMVMWNVFETDKITEKITGAVMLILLLLRLFLIK